MAKIILPISTGFEEIETCTVIDTCRRAGIEVIIVATDDIITSGAHNIKIEADKLIQEIQIDDFDMVVLPGGLPNAFNLAENNYVQELLKRAKEEDKYISAICAAPYALHKAKVLNHNYTCYPSFEEKIRIEGYHKDDDVVIDSKVITSRGPGTAMAFSLEIIRTLCGDEKVSQIEKELLL